MIRLSCLAMDSVSASTPHDAFVSARVTFKCIARIYNTFTLAAVLSDRLYRVPSRPGPHHLPESAP
jgi:hypothetical protein